MASDIEEISPPTIEESLNGGTDRSVKIGEECRRLPAPGEVVPHPIGYGLKKDEKACRGTLAEKCDCCRDETTLDLDMQSVDLTPVFPWPSLERSIACASSIVGENLKEVMRH
jgi:hypothetical protein